MIQCLSIELCAEYAYKFFNILQVFRILLLLFTFSFSLNLINSTKSESKKKEQQHTPKHKKTKKNVTLCVMNE